VVGLLRHLNVAQADVFGFSVGGAVALYLAIKHPELGRKLIVSSVSFHPTVTVRRTPRRWRH
jgi:pimeloyl-ACP methyl ester carboxylesterase